MTPQSGPKMKRFRSAVVTKFGDWDPSKSKFVRKIATSTPKHQNPQPNVSKPPSLDGTGNLSAGSSEAEFLVDATIEAENKEAVADYNWNSQPSDGSDIVCLLNAEDQYTASQLLQGSGDSWLADLNSPQLSPILPQVKSLAALCSSAVKSVAPPDAPLSLRTLAMVALPGNMMSSHDFGSLLMLGSVSVRAKTLVKLASDCVFKQGVPALRVIARISAACALGIACDVSKILPTQPNALGMVSCYRSSRIADA